MAEGDITFTLDGSIEFEIWPTKKLNFDKFDIKVAGYTLPSLSAGWLAYNLASGVIAGIGGMLFKVLFTMFGGGGPSMEEQLRKLLEEIKQALREQFMLNAREEAAASLDSTMRLMRQYMNNPAERFRLEEAVVKSSDAVSKLARLDLYGYGLYLSAANIHLATLQEFSKVSNDRQNYIEALGEFIAYHHRLDKRIDEEASGDGQARRWWSHQRIPARNLIPFTFVRLWARFAIITEDVLQTRPQDLPRLAFDHPDVEAMREDVAEDLYFKGRFERRRELTSIDRKSMQYRQAYTTAGIQVRAWLSEKKHPQPRLGIVDWETLRKQKRKETVDYGAPTVLRWSIHRTFEIAKQFGRARPATRSLVAVADAEPELPVGTATDFMSVFGVDPYAAYELDPEIKAATNEDSAVANGEASNTDHMTKASESD